MLTEHDLAHVLGGADTTATDSMPDYMHELLQRRAQLIERREDLETLRVAPWKNDPLQTTYEHAKAGDELQQITKQLNAEYRKHHLEEMQKQAHEAELKELQEHERKAQEAEEDAWLKQADAELAAEAAARQGGGNAGPPANADAGPGEMLPSFPTNIINPPPSHEPTIVLEPIEQEHRLY